MDVNEFTCSVCDNTYEKEWTDEEALEERGKLWPSFRNDDDFQVICDDCFIRFKSWNKRNN